MQGDATHLSYVLHHSICLVNDEISQVGQIKAGAGANCVCEPPRGDH